MIAFKSCPRCQGDLHLGLEGEFSCLQCGYEARPDEKQAIIARLSEAHKRHPVSLAA
jgi:DNA-directed RNA polymerase subunit M/transcription elongation factor TFIIS